MHVPKHPFLLGLIIIISTVVLSLVIGGVTGLAISSFLVGLYYSKQYKVAMPRKTKLYVTLIVTLFVCATFALRLAVSGKKLPGISSITDATHGEPAVLILALLILFVGIVFYPVLCHGMLSIGSRMAMKKIKQVAPVEPAAAEAV